MNYSHISVAHRSHRGMCITSLSPSRSTSVVMPRNEATHGHQALLLSSPSDNCALDKNGSLMDASQISFFNSPSDERPISGPGMVHVEPASPSPVPKGPKLTSRPKRNANRSKYHQAIAALDSESDNNLQPVPALVTSKEPSTRKRKKQALSDSDIGPTVAVSGPSAAPPVLVADTPSLSLPPKKTGSSTTRPVAKKAKSNPGNKTSLATAHHYLKRSAPITQQLEAPESLPSTETASKEPASDNDSPCTSDDSDSNASSSESMERSGRPGKEDVLTVCVEVVKAKKDRKGKYECTICA